MKRYLKSAVLLGMISIGTMYASFEFRTPLSLDWRGTFHWFLTPPEDTWWYGMMPGEKTIDWEIRTWSAGYARNADKAFFNVEENKNTTKTTTLSTLIFGKETFRGEEAFTNGTFAGASTADLVILNQNNPFVGFAFITPRFEYFEYGAYWGIDAYRRFGKDERWFGGIRADLPFKVIDVEQQDDDSFEEEIGDVVRERSRFIDNAGDNNEEPDFAARLDFLSTMLSGTNAALEPAPNQPFVIYNAPKGNVNIAGKQVTDTTADGANASAYALVSVNSQLPLPNPGFKKQPSQVSGPLPADGSTNNGAILFFQTDTDYADNLAKDRNAQGQLFVVPRTDDGVTLTDDAGAISIQIFNNLVASMESDETASDFFKSKGIDLFAHQRVTAVGDLDAEGYVGYGDYATWFVQGILGFRFPTGKKQENSNLVYFKPAGNNGHAEIKLGLDGGWRPREWFAFEIDASFHHAFRRTEDRAAAFKGATIRNIGPQIDAKVSWSYFLLRTELNFFHPQNPELGCCFGYELFAKGRDHVSFEQKTATDLFNRPNQPLDAEIYEKRTNSLSNKIQGQFFHRWNFFEFFAGGSQIVAGRNVMKETEAHIGFVKYF